MVMQDLGGIFADYKDKPTCPACTDAGLKIAEEILDAVGFKQVFRGSRNKWQAGMDIQAMPNYVSGHLTTRSASRMRRSGIRKIADQHPSATPFCHGKDQTGFAYSSGLMSSP